MGINRMFGSNETSMDSIKHLEYLYNVAMCRERHSVTSPSPQPSMDSGMAGSENGEGNYYVCRFNSVNIINKNSISGFRLTHY